MHPAEPSTLRTAIAPAASLPDEEELAQHLRREVNAALDRGGRMVCGMGVAISIFLFAANHFQVVRGLELVPFFSLYASAYSYGIHFVARRGAVRGHLSLALFLPLAVMPTAFFLTAQLAYPAGASTFITGPFSYTYFLFIAASGFFFDASLSILTGLLSAVGYGVVFLISRGSLQAIPMTDPLLAQELTSPALFAIKCALMAFCGALTGGTSLLARRLILRVLAEEHANAFITNTFGRIVDPRVRDQMIAGTSSSTARSARRPIFSRTSAASPRSRSSCRPATCSCS